MQEPPSPVHATSRPGVRWSTVNFAEAIQGVQTPLGWTLWSHVMERAIRRAFGELGALPRAEVPPSGHADTSISAAFFGYAAGNVSVFRRIGDAMRDVRGCGGRAAVRGAPPGYGHACGPGSRRRYPYIDPRAQRFMVWLSIGMILVFGVSYAALTGFWPPRSPSLPAEEVMHLYADHYTTLRIGVVICLITAAYNLPWSIVLGPQMARHEKGVPLWSILQVLTGTLGVLLLMLPALFWGVAAFSPNRAPETTLLMHELAFLTFVTPVTFFALQALPVIVIGLRDKDQETSALPRWVGILTTAEVGVFAQLFKTDPFAWNGVFTFCIPLSVFVVWFFALAYTMLRAVSRQERDAAAAAPERALT